jgi:hypothetical protein
MRTGRGLNKDPADLSAKHFCYYFLLSMRRDRHSVRAGFAERPCSGNAGASMMQQGDSVNLKVKRGSDARCLVYSGS